MNNTEKLLRAFIEASGYEIEEVRYEGKGKEVSSREGGAIAISSFMCREPNKLLTKSGAYVRGVDGSYFLKGDVVVDYKVTKKLDSVWYDDVVHHGVSATIVNTDGTITRVHPEDLFKGAPDEKT